MGLFVLAEGLENTGVIRWAAQRLATLGRGGSERRLLLTLMAAAATLSLGMNNVAVGALFLPASSRVARSSGVPSGPAAPGVVRHPVGRDGHDLHQREHHHE